MSMSGLSQIFHFLQILVLRELRITDWIFCDRLGPHQAGPILLLMLLVMHQDCFTQVIGL